MRRFHMAPAEDPQVAGLSAAIQALARIDATPALVWLVPELVRAANAVAQLAAALGARNLYSLKACPLSLLARTVGPLVSGYSCSSLFEVELAMALKRPEHTLHFVSPLIDDQILARSDALDFVTFNSLNQLQRFGSRRLGRSCGLRVNPGVSATADPRYDACRPHSKLGIPLQDLQLLERTQPGRVRCLDGLHVHCNFDSADLDMPSKVLQELAATVPRTMEQISWINMGGGYLPDEASNVDLFAERLRAIAERFSLVFFIEPGAAYVRSAGLLVASVTDLISSGGKTVAVLDTSVNHMPEVFEYQLRPPIAGDTKDGQHAYILAGASCVAGDVFGEYRFEEPLRIGARLTFTHAGAYTLSKANMFNGLPLPAIYAIDADGAPRLVKRVGYEAFDAIFGDGTSGAAKWDVERG